VREGEGVVRCAHCSVALGVALPVPNGAGTHPNLKAIQMRLAAVRACPNLATTNLLGNAKIDAPPGVGGHLREDHRASTQQSNLRQRAVIAKLRTIGGGVGVDVGLVDWTGGLAVRAAATGEVGSRNDGCEIWVA